jgi:hypothetical protein
MKSRKNGPIWRKKVLFHQDNAQINQNDGNIPWIRLQIASPFTVWGSRSGLSNFFLFADLKRMLDGKKFSTNEEVITETEAYFEAMSKSYYKNGIEKKYDRYYHCIALERNYIE